MAEPRQRLWRWRRGVWLVLLLCALAPARVGAQAAVPSDTRIVVSGCSMRVNERTLHDQVRVELLAAGVQRVRTVELYADDLSLEEEAADVATLRVTFPDCDEADGEIRLGIAARHTGKHLERTLAVSDVRESMHARAIALALTELLRASWYELATTRTEPQPPAPSVRPRIAAEVVMEMADRSQAARELRQRLRLEWHGGGRIYPQTDSGEASSAFALSKLFGARTRLVVAASAGGGGGQGSDARLFQTTARTTLSLCGQSDDPGLEVGATMEVGYARLNGTQAGTTSGVVSTALVQGTLRMQAAQEIEALITLQAGYVLTPVTLRGPAADDGGAGPKVGFQGAVIGIEVGVAGLL